ncbi:uncharacterized protein B0I36DRAFT_15397 [Microdochium trichocladiopsis]|uniref:Uncharacterized protein n=1 Tax=Microdochium trichocladiopsis TaxID=1682393 RepID=A0A9P8YIS9_9PEZI|nr:uncharacterized protein B0I36DRAFT_15397 [Microdochium trichocladiopsis]KAH7040793.1 hypothetical protein B0I36DRAFT_15397 [Microdochium trichocladiopsis]
MRARHARPHPATWSSLHEAKSLLDLIFGVKQSISQAGRILGPPPPEALSSATLQGCRVARPPKSHVCSGFYRRTLDACLFSERVGCMIAFCKKRLPLHALELSSGSLRSRLTRLVYGAPNKSQLHVNDVRVSRDSSHCRGHCHTYTRIPLLPHTYTPTELAHTQG